MTWIDDNMESVNKNTDYQRYEKQLEESSRSLNACSRDVSDLDNPGLMSEVQELRYQNDAMKRVLRTIISTPNVDRLKNQHLEAENEELREECRVLREFIESRFRMPKLDIAGDFDSSDE